ncbi:hypothetical protein LBMAG48_28940 [Phycisphaerae bacterium]|jgi:hypothetical protein|nr:hypothetical protein LBMAG48_28940 [Phycisphaerae bacterium]
MSGFWGEISGDSVRERAIRLAGALAELSQQKILLSQNGISQPVQARVTDLPGMIEREVADCGTAFLEAPQLGARFTLSTDAALWEAPTPQIADVLRRKFHM